MDLTYTDAISSIMREARLGAMQAVSAEGGKGGALLAGQAKMASPGGDTAANNQYDGEGELHSRFLLGISVLGDPL